MNMVEPIEFLRSLFDVAVAAVDPAIHLPRYLPSPPKGRTLLLAAGKAAASMAAATEKHWPGEITGLAVTRYGHGCHCDKIEVVEAGHPLPDRAGLFAANRFLSLASDLSADDLLLFLVSGGSSALLVHPANGLTLKQKRAINVDLLNSGAPIEEMNCVRKHLSQIKGGRLAAAAHPARTVTLAVSDVPDDDPAVIGSGPTVGDPTSCGDALAIAQRRNICLPATVRRALDNCEWESIAPNSALLKQTSYHLKSRPANALKAAADSAMKVGIKPTLLGDNLKGEARDLAGDHAWKALQESSGVLISGGETTVTISKYSGRGGRNCEYLLALALELQGAPGIYAIACDTDGLDGTEDAAGAIIGPDTLPRANTAGLDASGMLRDHNSYTFFAKLGDLVLTGPTRTNVNDFRAILISSSDPGRAVL